MKMERKHDDEDTLTLESILQEKEEIRKLLESLDAKVESKSSSSNSSRSEKNNDGVKEERVVKRRRRKKGSSKRKTHQQKEKKDTAEPNESERMLMLQFNICHKDATETLRDCSGDLVRAVLKLTEIQVEDIVKMSENQIDHS